MARGARQRGGRRRARRGCATVAATTENLVPATIELAQGRRHRRRMGRRAARGVRRVPRAHGGRRGRRRAGRRDRGGARPQCATIAARVRRRRSGCSSASPASTATRTAPSRSRSRPATPAWRSSTRGSGSRPAEIAAAARDEDVDVVGPLDPLRLAPRAGARRPSRPLRAAGVDAPVVVGGIIPDADRAELEAMGVASVYTPKDYRLAAIIADIADLARAQRRRALRPGPTTADEKPRWRIRDSWSPCRRRPGRARRRRGRSRHRTRRSSRSWPAAAGVVAAIAGRCARSRGPPATATSSGRPRTRSAPCGASSRRSTPCCKKKSSRRAAEEELGPTPTTSPAAQRAGVRPGDRPLRRAVLRGARAAARRRGPPVAATGLGRDLRDRQHGRGRHATPASRRSVSSATSCAAHCARATPRAASAT